MSRTHGEWVMSPTRESWLTWTCCITLDSTCLIAPCLIAPCLLRVTLWDMSHGAMSPTSPHISYAWVMTHMNVLYHIGQHMSHSAMSHSAMSPTHDSMRHVSWRHVSWRHVSYRVAYSHRMLYLYGSFSTKEPYNEWLFCGKRSMR